MIKWYPSIGNKGYWYSDWQSWRPENAWLTLDFLAEKYNGMFRVLRNKYRWPPDVVDKIGLKRLTRIFDETIEDNKERKEEDF